MDKEKAKIVLAEQLRHYRGRPYVVLKSKIGQVDAYEIARDEVSYQIEIQVMWDGKSEGDIRVIGAIDDGRWSAFSPLCDDFIMTPDGKFLGE